MADKKTKRERKVKNCTAGRGWTRSDSTAVLFGASINHLGIMPAARRLLGNELPESGLHGIRGI
jgi:hypothetical protein